MRLQWKKKKTLKSTTTKNNRKYSNTSNKTLLDDHQVIQEIGYKSKNFQNQMKMKTQLQETLRYNKQC
jgi:hypothetical protein